MRSCDKNDARYGGAARAQTRARDARAGCGAAHLLAEHLRLALEAADDAVGGRVEVGHIDRLLVGARRHERALVAHVGDLGAREARRERRELLRDVVEVAGEAELLHFLVVGVGVSSRTAMCDERRRASAVAHAAVVPRARRDEGAKRRAGIAQQQEPDRG